MRYSPVIISFKHHNLQTITIDPVDVIWTHRSQVLSIICVVYSTLLRIPKVHKIYKIHQFAMYLGSVYKDYTRFGVEEDESIILQNCQSFFYTSNQKLNNIYNLLNNFAQLKIMSSVQCLHLNFAKTVLPDNQLSLFFNFIDDSPLSFDSSSESLIYEFVCQMISDC
ncbi:11756_t:CDS:2 [Racocetra fulgida]|uniref:11756_t:CDS:1 n=1 Tax=Racocetra fulgida TaxID=60492 RepID=A0A9N8Z2N1_9GLOM|nr:11756_t:CDS:2 [Racocetra fulgida]